MVVRHVPAQICDNCGEEYLDEATTEEALSQAEAAARQGVTVEVREFAVALPLVSLLSKSWIGCTTRHHNMNPS